VPLPVGTNARHLRQIARWSLLVMVLSAPLALWWPSIQGWAALGAAALAIWILWLCWRCLTGATDVPGHLVYLALAGVWGLACYHAARWHGMPPPGQPRPLMGQFAASLAVHIALTALLILLVQDLLARKRLGSLIPTLFGAAAIAGAVVGLLTSRRSEGRLMLGLMGFTGVSVFCWPLWRRRSGGDTTVLTTWRRAERTGRVGLALVAATGLAVLCPISVLVATAAAAITLVVAAACLPGRRTAFGLAALIAAVSGAAHAWTLGWIRSPAWPRTLADWIGRGGDGLIQRGPWINDLRLLVGAVGWGGALWLLAWLMICLVWGLWGVRRRPREHARAVLACFAAVLAATAWLSPGGLFNPAVNVTFAAVWAIWPAALSRRANRHSGWWVLAVVVVLSLTLALVSRVGLLAWAAGVYGGDDDLLHIFIGWLITHVLLWLLTNRRFGAWIAVGISLAAAAGGEAAQAYFSSRSAQPADILGHAKGAALAGVIYVICRACRWSESPDVAEGLWAAKGSEPSTNP